MAHKTAQELIAALEANGGSVARAAAALGISQQAIYKRLPKLGIRLERRVVTKT